MHHKSEKVRETTCLFGFRLYTCASESACLSTMTRCRELCDWAGRATAACADCGLRTQIRSNCWIRGLTANRFLPRDALVHSAVLRLHVVRRSVRLSVTLVDQDHIRWKSWKLIARSMTNTFALRSRKAIHLIGNICGTRKDRGKVTMESL